MTYNTPQVQPVGVASALIQTKLPKGIDNGQQNHVAALSNLLDK